VRRAELFQRPWLQWMTHAEPEHRRVGHDLTDVLIGDAASDKPD
jgi:hypothetical protein